MVTINTKVNVTTMVEMVTTVSIVTLLVITIYAVWSKRHHVVLCNHTICNILFPFNRGAPSKYTLFKGFKITKVKLSVR